MFWLVFDGGGPGWWMVIPVAFMGMCILMMFGMFFGRGRMHGMGPMRGMESTKAEPDQRTPNSDARDVARDAYARGELDRERFLQIMKDLDESGPDTS